MKTWTVKLGYSQDNWYVNGWYGKTNSSDLGSFTVDRNGAANTADPAGNTSVVKFEDSTYTSLAGGVTIDKVALYAVYDISEVTAQTRWRHESRQQRPLCYAGCAV